MSKSTSTSHRQSISGSSPLFPHWFELFPDEMMGVFGCELAEDLFVVQQYWLSEPARLYEMLNRWCSKYQNAFILDDSETAGNHTSLYLFTSIHSKWLELNALFLESLVDNTPGLEASQVKRMKLVIRQTSLMQQGCNCWSLDGQISELFQSEEPLGSVVNGLKLLQQEYEKIGKMFADEIEKIQTRKPDFMTTESQAKKTVEEQQEQINDMSNAGMDFFSAALSQQADMFKSMSLDPFNMADTYMQAMMNIWKNPDSMMSAQQEYFENSLKLWGYAAGRLMGDSETAPVIEPIKGDNRWRSEEWSNNVVFDYIKQSYLLAARCVETTVDGVDELPEKDAKRLSFFTKQFLDAMAPTNYPHTNPDVLKATLENKGENLVAGLKNFVRDMEEGDGKLKIAMTDPEAFTLGENVATTPGKVVFQNKMLQLLQYSPSTEEVYKRPLLIVPPWINKFYILDLQPKNSMIKWLVDQGHTVFVVSWVNPNDDSYADIGWDDYVQDGIYAAIDAVQEATGEDALNVAGYCIGGTLLASTLAHMEETGDERVKTATFFTTLTDFSDPGDLGVFIDDQQIESLEEGMGDGFLQGKTMSTAFNMLRSNDLIWSFYINNYLLGKAPTIFDLLYWNSDSTNMPAKMHSFYLRNMYLDNKLCQPGGITVKNIPVDLGKIKTPAYFISAKEDHIAPWESTYAGAKLFSGPVRFVLGGSGHIAGIVNPPVKNKYGYWTGAAKLPAQSGEWLDKAKQHEGSWWNDWDKWLATKSKAKVDARVPGEGKLKAIEDAPGSYVTKRI